MAAVTMFMSAPGQSYSVAAFVDPMLKDLQILRSEYSTAYVIATLVSGLSLPFIGRLLDAQGARRMLPLVALLLGLSCYWMSGVRDLVGLCIGFCMVRCLGQGTMTMISTWLVGEWFERRRGLATGLVGLGGTLSVMSFPQVNNALIEAFGWRTAWLVLGVLVCGAVILPALLFVRNRPEDLGLLPDGRSPGAADASEAAGPLPDAPANGPVLTDEAWTAPEASRTSTFWKLVAVIATSALVGTGLVFHQVSLLADHGVARGWALNLIGMQALVATIVGLIAGYLSDRTPPRYLLATSMGALSGGLLLLMTIPGPSPAILYAALLGIHGGIIRSAGTVVWINFFGRLHQGAVRGLALSFAIIAAALGPLPLALAKDWFGDYRPALLAFLVLPVVAGVLVVTAHPPIRKGQGTPQPEPA